MSNETVTYSLEAVLTRIEGKIDSLQRDVNQKLIGQSELKGEIKALGFKIEGIDKRLEKVENEQSVLVKSVSDLQGFRGLILPLIVGGISAGIGAIITVSIRFSLLGGNP
jgi:septal ring factor EnvC (AmiA/AmiB activator)